MLTVYWKYNRYDEGWLEYKREATSLLDPNYSHALQYYMLQCFRSLKPSSGYEYLVPHSIFWLFPTHIQLASELVFGLIKGRKCGFFSIFVCIVCPSSISPAWLHGPCPARPSSSWFLSCAAQRRAGCRLDDSPAKVPSS